MKLLLLLIGLIFMGGGELCAQKIAPLQGDLSLSGNFAELRSAHFHGGLDFRTGGVIGKPVFAVDDGFVSRISVSPVGYGKALYLDHPDGTTTVYAHLDSYEPSLSKIVRSEQYKQKSFKVDFVPADTIYFKKGDIIARSGNSGSSGGPHLHFEIRETESNLLLNPSHYIKVNDNIAPEIRGIYIYSVDMSGLESRSRKYAVQRSGSTYNAGRVVVGEGVFGLGVHIVDRMEGSTGKLGVYKMELYAENQLISTYVADTVDFAQNRYVNLLGDYRAYGQRETVYKTFGGNWSGVKGCSADFDGYIGVEQDSVVNLRLLLADINGNVSTLKLSVKGGEAKRASYDGVVWYVEEGNSARLGACKLLLDKASLIRNVLITPEIHVDTVKDREVIGFVKSDEPLLKAVKIKMFGKYDERAVLCRVNNRGNLIPMPTRWHKDSLCSESTILGRYSVAVDSVAPKLLYRGKRGSKINFSVADGMTGIGDIQLFVNGVWTLYEFDAKRNALFVKMDEPAFKSEENVIELRVKDVVGNSSQLTLTI